MRKILLHNILLFIGLGVLGLFVFAPKPAIAANPATINFQGKVVRNDTGNVGINPTSTTYSITFRIYDNASPTIGANCNSNSQCWWEETQASVQVTNGVFQVELGSVCAFTSACGSTHSGINFNTNNSLYLTMKFGSDTSFMTPVIHLTTVPYAFNADQLGGISSSGFIQNNTGSAQTSSSFHIDGTGIADVKLQAPSFDTATSNGGLGIGTANAGTITLGNTTNSTFLFTPKSSATAVVFQNTSSKAAVTIDTASSQLVLGTSSTGGVNGTIALKNTSNSNTLTIVTGVTAASGGSGYTLTLPTTGASASGQCLQSGSGSTVGSTNLTFSSCGAGGGTLASTYNSSGTSGNTIALTSGGGGGGGIYIQDASTTVGTMFDLQKNGGTLDYLSLTLVSTVPHLRVFDGTSNSNYADIYFSGGSAIYAASGSNTTQLGSGSGAISIDPGGTSAFTIIGHAASSVTTDTSSALTLTSAAAATWSTSAGLLTLQGAGGISVIGSSTNTVTVDSGSTGSVNVGSGSNSKAVTVGNLTSGTTTNIYGGTGNAAVQIQASTNGTIQIGGGGGGSSNNNTINIGPSSSICALGCPSDTVNIAAGGTASVTIGSAGSSSSLVLQAGTGSVAITSGQDINLQATGNLNIGAASSITAKIVLYNSTNSNTITLQNGATAASITVNFPKSAPGNSVQQGASYLPFATNLTADSAAASSTTLANLTASGNANDALSLTIPANTSVSFTVNIIYVSSSTSNTAIIGWKCSNASQSSLATGTVFGATGFAGGGTTTACGTTAANIVTGPTTLGSTNPAQALISGTIKANAAAATTVTFQYARSGSTGNTTIKAGSSIQWWQ